MKGRESNEGQEGRGRKREGPARDKRQQRKVGWSKLRNLAEFCGAKPYMREPEDGSQGESEGTFRVRNLVA